MAMMSVLVLSMAGVQVSSFIGINTWPTYETAASSWFIPTIFDRSPMSGHQLLVILRAFHVGILVTMSEFEFHGFNDSPGLVNGWCVSVLLHYYKHKVH